MTLKNKSWSKIWYIKQHKQKDREKEGRKEKKEENFCLNFLVHKIQMDEEEANKYQVRGRRIRKLSKKEKGLEKWKRTIV